ncbi:MAG TPA: Mrp/NBP35 family ATP-binding protein [Pirellulales bacterium]|nr:Mrp/NBP35 family ATP-binding protein [Pirellulales bacterium]
MSQEVEKALSELKDPETGRSVVQQGQIGDVRLEGDRLSLTLALSTHSAPLWKRTQEECVSLLRRHFPAIKEIDVRIAVHPRPPQKLGEIGLTAKSVIAVGSGKGGVGKSTMAASLAYGLKRAGSTVGLMDADVYGPSIPHLVGVNERPEIVDKRIKPIEVEGLKVMSMGFLVPPGEAVVWRGPMLHGAITQFLRDTAWGELDYLIIDMPPGTGDIALTLSQLLPLTGAVVVCTPQDVALLDAVKAIAMFRKVNIPILGMIENMSYFLCPGCGNRYDIFGSGGAKKRAAELEIPFLGEVPINMQIRVNGDAGQLAGNYEPTAGAEYFEAICNRLVSNLADKHRAAPPLPKLSVLG